MPSYVNQSQLRSRQVRQSNTSFNFSKPSENFKAGVTLPPVPADLSTPVQQRVSFNGPTSVSVAWNTYEQQAQPCVRYGTNSKSLTSQVCGTRSVTYSTSRTWANLVVVSGLKPATVYYYAPVSTSSTVNQFMTARTAGDKTPFSMITLADLGLYGEDGYMTKKRELIPAVDPVLNHTTIGSLAKRVNTYEFIIHPGDFAYADDWIEDITNAADGAIAYSAIIERFYNQYDPAMANKPYLVSPRNHEANCQEIPYTSATCPAGQNNFSDFQNRFDGMMPTAFPTASKNATAQSLRNYAKTLAVPPFWYSFDYGMVHVVMINTETDFSNAPHQEGGSAGLAGGPFAPSGQQVKFLQADLASVDQSITSWVVVVGHRPWYTVGDQSATGGSVCTPCQTAFEDIFYQYGVDLGIFGHVHNIQRFGSTYKNAVDPTGKAPYYIVIGGPGNIEGHDPTTPTVPGNEFAYNSTYGYGQLTFHNSFSLEIQMIDSASGIVLDSATIN